MINLHSQCLHSDRFIHSHGRLWPICWCLGIGNRTSFDNLHVGDYRNLLWSPDRDDILLALLLSQTGPWNRF